MTITPECCGVDATWVDLGTDRLRYWYCGECKNEVSSLRSEAASSLSLEQEFERLIEEGEQERQDMYKHLDNLDQVGGDDPFDDWLSNSTIDFKGFPLICHFCKGPTPSGTHCWNCHSVI